MNLPAIARTITQVVVAFLVNQARQRLGWELPTVELEAVIQVVILGLVVQASSWLSDRFPWIGRIWSLGTAASAPAYHG